MKVKYKALIERDEDGWFVATCPKLPGCISQGKTLEEARANIIEAATCYTESLRKHNEPIPPPDADIPEISGRSMVEALLKVGFEIDEQTKKQFVLHRYSSPGRRIVVPNQKKLVNGAVMAIIRDAGLTVEQFADLL